MRIECPNCGHPADTNAVHACGVFVSDAGEAIYPPPPPPPPPEPKPEDTKPDEPVTPKDEPEESKERGRDKDGRGPRLRGFGFFSRREE